MLYSLTAHHLAAIQRRVEEDLEPARTSLPYLHFGTCARIAEPQLLAFLIHYQSVFVVFYLPVQVLDQTSIPPRSFLNYFEITVPEMEPLALAVIDLILQLLAVFLCKKTSNGLRSLVTRVGDLVRRRATLRWLMLLVVSVLMLTCTTVVHGRDVLVYVDGLRIHCRASEAL